MSEETNPVGRPSAYREEFTGQAYKLCLLLGATDAELAAFFEVSETTINNWKHEHPEFLESIKEGKAKADSFVAMKLYDRATGAEWIEDAAFKVKKVEYVNGKRASETEDVVTVPVKRSAPPDTTAAIFWLKNRASRKWNDKVINELTGADGSALAIAVTFIDQPVNKPE